MPERTGRRLGRWFGMKRPEPAMDWPQWATWALLAVIVTSIVTIAAAINDIW